MTSDPSPGTPPPGPGRLWTEPRETEEHQQWLEPGRSGRAPAALQPPPAPPGTRAPGARRARPGEPDARPPGARQTGSRPAGDATEDRAILRRRRLLGILIGTIVALLLIGAGVLGARLFSNDDDNAASPAALPAVPGAVVADQRTRSIRAIYASAKRSVVPVRVRIGPTSGGSGTGFVIDKGGVIVTHAHVVKDAQLVQVRLTDNGGYVRAKVVGMDLSSDLAVLHVDSPAAAKLRPLPLADSDNVQVGDQTLAIGYPLGLNRSSSASAGIVSGLGRSIDAQNAFSIDKVIQTDAAINPGNSGGPLLDAAGRVIGVDAAILTAGSGGSVGIGFAIPSNTMRTVVPLLESGKKVQYAYLGVQTSENAAGTGADVGGLTPNAPAAAGGLKVGDTIVAVAGHKVSVPEDISVAIEDHRPGQSIDIAVKRGGSRKTLHVTLGNRPQTSATSSSPTIP
jgi:putative serine protease PepD